MSAILTSEHLGSFLSCLGHVLAFVAGPTCLIVIVANTLCPALAHVSESPPRQVQYFLQYQSGGELVSPTTKSG
jgi:hypothetical protein